MRILALLLLAAQAVTPAPKTMSALMIDPIYPASDAVFYISTRTPTSAVEWRALEDQTVALAEAANALTGPMYFRDRDRWMADAKLMIDASAAAVDAARHRDVGALVGLNDALYSSCVRCHQHYRPGYGSRPSAGAAASRPDLDGVWAYSTLTPLERIAEFAGKPELTPEEAAAYEKRTVERSDRDKRDTSSPEADVGGAYNEFWWERGTLLASVNGRKRTSLIVDPPEGRIPALTAEGQQRAAARAADRRDHGFDGPESRALAERSCSSTRARRCCPAPTTTTSRSSSSPIT